jgi:N-acetylmuramic acid 6-phosphate etherase
MSERPHEPASSASPAAAAASGAPRPAAASGAPQPAGASGAIQPAASDSTRPAGAPLNRGHLLTEQAHPASSDLDCMSTREILELMHADDRRALEAVGDALEDVERAAALVLEAFRAGGRLIYVGAGTSGRLGVLDAAECPPTFSTPPSMVQAVIAGGPEALVRAREGAEDDAETGAAELRRRKLEPRDVIVGIAAGGTTPFVEGALREARRAGARTALVTCVPGAPLARIVDVAVTLPVGPEILTGSTRLKAGTATKLVLNMLTTSAMVGLGKVYGNRMVDLQVTAAKLEDRGRRILVDLLGIGYEAAGELLGRSAGSVKLALVMGHRGVDRETAARLLDERSGFVRDLLEPLRPAGGASERDSA